MNWAGHQNRTHLHLIMSRQFHHFFPVRLMGTQSPLQQSGTGETKKNVVRSAPTKPALINRIICVWLKQTDCRRNASFLLTFSFLFFFLSSSGQLSWVRWGISLTDGAGRGRFKFPAPQIEHFVCLFNGMKHSQRALSRSIEFRWKWLEQREGRSQSPWTTKLRYSTNKVRKNSKKQFQCPTDVDRFPRDWSNHVHIFHPKSRVSKLPVDHVNIPIGRAVNFFFVSEGKSGETRPTAHPDRRRVEWHPKPMHPAIYFPLSTRCTTRISDRLTTDPSTDGTTAPCPDLRSGPLVSEQRVNYQVMGQRSQGWGGNVAIISFLVHLILFKILIKWTSRWSFESLDCDRCP